MHMLVGVECLTVSAQPRLFSLWLKTFLTFWRRTKGSQMCKNGDHFLSPNTRYSQNSQKTLAWPTIIDFSSKLTKPFWACFSTFLKDWMARRDSFDHFNHFYSETGARTGVSQTFSTGERAGSSLEGGLTTTMEGLGHSWNPCTTRLSVAGFYAHSSLFPGPGEVYSQLRKEPFLFREASLSQPDVHNCHQRAVTSGY